MPTPGIDERRMLSPFELLTTTRTVRKRLDLSRSVPRADIEECLRIAWQAPNASNQQRFNWVVVDDPTLKVAVADVYRRGMDVAYSLFQQGKIEAYHVSDRRSEIDQAVVYLRDHLHEVPALVIPTIDGRMEGQSVYTQASRWGSILPAAWSFMLALHSKGMGSAWTTVHLHQEREMAELLGIPADEVTQVGLFPVAYTIGQDFKPGSRQHSGRSIRWNGWGSR